MKYLHILIMTVLFISCEGPVGPQGIQGESGTEGIDGTDGTDGEQGIQGEQGPGTRIVYSGMITSNNMLIIVPEMSMVDPPSIDVLLCPEDASFGCFPTPIFFEDANGTQFETWFTTNDQFVRIFNASLFAGNNSTYAIIVIE